MSMGVIKTFTVEEIMESVDFIRGCEREISVPILDYIDAPVARLRDLVLSRENMISGSRAKPIWEVTISDFPDLRQIQIANRAVFIEGLFVVVLKDRHGAPVSADDRVKLRALSGDPLYQT